MLKRITIIIGSLAVLALVVLAIIFIPSGTAKSSTVNDYMASKAYLSKNGESYARCYNSINYGASVLTDVRLAILSENFSDSSITPLRLDTIQESFMKTVKDRCQKTVDAYENAYDKANRSLTEIKDTETSWWTLVTGSSGRELTTDNLDGYLPASARITVAFNDVVFTNQEAKQYFRTQLGL